MMVRLLPLAVLVLALAIGGGAAIMPAASETPSPSVSPTGEASATPRATSQADFLTPTPEFTLGSSPSPTFEPKRPAVTPAPGPWSPPDGYTGSLRPDTWVQISGTDSCLNARITPGLDVDVGDGTTVPVAVLNCLPDGFVGRLGGQAWFKPQGMPELADGHWWWHMVGQGWIAEDWLTHVSGDGLPYPPRPELTGAGLVAYISAGNVWVMEADGSASRMIFAVPASSAYVTAVRWSPDGGLLAASADVPGSETMTVTWIMAPDGALVSEHRGLMDPLWSPDGRYLSALRATGPGGLGGSVGGPVILDLATGVETAIEGIPATTVAPAWSPDGSAVALVCYSGSSWEYFPDGTSRETRTECPGGDGLRIISPASGEQRVLLPMDWVGGAYYSNPSWSPDGQTIALSMSGLQSPCQGYGVISAADGSLLNCFELPTDYAGGGRCGGGLEGGASDWSLDGRLFAYHWQYRVGVNGVAVVDMSTGARTMIPSMDATSVSLSSSGGHLVFGGSGYVWAADTSGAGGLTLLAEGSLPAWQPTL